MLDKKQQEKLGDFLFADESGLDIVEVAKPDIDGNYAISESVNDLDDVILFRIS